MRSMYVCLCKAVTDTQIRDAVDEGLVSFEQVQRKLDVSSVCGTCACEVKDVIAKRLNSALAANSGHYNTTIKEIQFAV